MRWLLAILELFLMCWFVAVGFTAAFDRAMVDRHSPFRMNEFHHAFVGVALVVLGFRIPGPTGVFVQLLGLVVTIDDLWQHHVQTIDSRYSYRSPLHVLFQDIFADSPVAIWLTAFLDRWWFAAVVFGLLAVWLFT